MTPWKPFPIERPVTSTSSDSTKTSLARIWSPTLTDSSSPSSWKRNSLRTLVAGTPAWHAWYRGVQDDAIERLGGGGGVVYWVGYPACDVSPPNESIFNALAASAAARHPGTAVYLDLHSAVCPGGPLLALELPDGTPVDLLNDGAHFTPLGAEWVGYWLTAQIGPTFALPAPS